MKKIIITFLFMVSNIALPQTGWIVYNTSMNAKKNDIKFINSSTGFLVGDTNYIFKSTNGGLNWTSHALPQSYPASIKTVTFLNQYTGYAGGGHHWDEYNYSKYLFKTTNCGESWSRIFFDSLYSMYGAIVNIVPFSENEIVGSNSGYVEVFMTGGIFKSTNGGLNFTYKGIGGACNSISFLNSNTGYAVNKITSDFQPTVTKIFKTTDGCASWTVLYRDSAQGSGSSFTKIQVFDANNVYALNSFYNTGNYYTRFFKSSSGGSNWNYTQETNGRNYTMYFLNPSTGWLGGYRSSDSSIISYTTNSGLNWNLQLNNLNVIVSGIFFLNETTGWAILYNDIRIMRTTTSGITFVSNTNDITPDKYSLSQNYPNPFNPVTKIRFEIPSREGWMPQADGVGLVTLKVFDIAGREIQTLVSEELQPGTYEVTFDGSGLNSGVYFYQLVAGSYKETRRLVLIK